MAEAVRLTALLAIRTDFSLTADGTLSKTRPTGYIQVPMQTQQKEKRKRSDVFKETTTNYDVPSRRVCFIASLKVLFEIFVRKQAVFRSVLTCFVLSGKSFAIFLVR